MLPVACGVPPADFPSCEAHVERGSEPRRRTPPWRPWPPGEPRVPWGSPRARPQERRWRLGRLWNREGGRGALARIRTEALRSEQGAQGGKAGSLARCTRFLLTVARSILAFNQHSIVW